jgi:hypothetical protein
MNTCQWVLKRGEHKGEICGAGCRNGNFCKNHSEKRREWHKQYGKMYKKEYYQQNRERLRQYTKKYEQDNREKILLKHKQYYKKNKEELLKQSKKYKNKVVLSVLVWNCKAHDKKYNRYFNLTEEWVKKILDHQEWKCYHCDQYLLLENGKRDSDQLSIDRVNNSKGHFKGNVVLSCWHCNYKRRKTDINIFTPNPKYTILQDDEESEDEESD